MSRHQHRKNAALTFNALNVNCATVGLDQLANDGEAEPATGLVAASTRTIAAPEAIEDMRKIFGGDARARVLHDYPKGVLFSLCTRMVT